jgi:hypothetical protein
VKSEEAGDGGGRVGRMGVNTGVIGDASQEEGMEEVGEAIYQRMRTDELQKKNAQRELPIRKS